MKRSENNSVLGDSILSFYHCKNWRLNSAGWAQQQALLQLGELPTWLFKSESEC